MQKWNLMRIKSAFKFFYLDFLSLRGKIGRLTYLYSSVLLCIFAIFLFGIYIVARFQTNFEFHVLPWLSAAWLFWGMISLTIRRMRDIGAKWWWLPGCLISIALVGGLIEGLIDAKSGSNAVFSLCVLLYLLLNFKKGQKSEGQDENVVEQVSRHWSNYFSYMAILTLPSLIIITSEMYINSTAIQAQIKNVIATVQISKTEECKALAYKHVADGKNRLAICVDASNENPKDMQLQHILAKLYEISEDYVSALKHLRKAFDGGYTDAIYDFARFHTFAEDFGLKPKKNRASGIAKIMTQLGGDSNDETFKEAVRLYHLVIEKDPKRAAAAMRMLGHHYNERKGVPAAWAANKSKEWFTKAATLGDKEAKDILKRWAAQAKRDAENYVDPNDGPCPFPEQTRNLYGTCYQP